MSARDVPRGEYPSIIDFGPSSPHHRRVAVVDVLSSDDSTHGNSLPKTLSFIVCEHDPHPGKVHPQAPAASPTVALLAHHQIPPDPEY